MDDGEDGEDYGPIGVLPSVQSVQERINSRYDELIHVDAKGKYVPYVCLVCDEFIMHRDELLWYRLTDLFKCKHVLEWNAVMHEHERIPAVEENFRFVDHDDAVKDPSWLHRMGLSPRGIVKKGNRPNASGVFSCCERCSSALNKKRTPHFAIVNRNHIGSAPACLKELTPVELAMITPVEGYGYCFTFSGGAQRNLKGTMTFMRVQPRQVARAAMHLEGMGLKNHIVVLLSGPMTSSQRTRTKQEIRTNRILEAVEWLCSNNKKWKEEFRNELKDS
ncbi:hypothetical protein SEMRO_2869_G339060.1 [Seminavis robusta]|uniref:DUF6570 domain-containing protein n=1 Tax=Seminavis robusta TaxID=568900 RepID=A0A9N8F1V4_9STRA|nr:hypothetical protein SEMRO_2869_G339060.1 [Seminavis robusta]|eukprot:Sro2869_g339060.1 n/a (277) ;mRNA; r:7419-8249